MAGTIATDVSAALRDAEIVLIDLDGCLAFEFTPHPAAACLLRHLESRYVVLSNNSTETPQGLSEILAANGLPIEPERIVLAGALMVDILAAEAGDRAVYLMASPQIRAYASARGLRLVDDDSAGIVALARDAHFTYDRLNGALRLLRRGAELVVSNPDMTHPGADYMPVIETGALLALFRAGMPEVAPRIIGKPEAIMFETALERFGVDAADALMIGDNPDTDGLGAARAGIASVLVGPGSPYATIADLMRNGT